MLIGGYYIHLYCDNGESEKIYHHFHTSGGNSTLTVNGKEIPFEFSAQTKTGCMEQARRVGWVIGSDGLVLCPMCKQHGVKLRQIRERDKA